MNWDMFTKQIKEDLSDMESKDELAKIWGRLEAPVDELNARKKKKNRGLFPIFLLGSIALMGVLFLFYVNQTNVNKVSEKHVEIEIPVKEIIIDQSTATTENKLKTSSYTNENENTNSNSKTLTVNDSNDQNFIDKKLKNSDRPNNKKSDKKTISNSIEKTKTKNQINDQNLFLSIKKSEKEQSLKFDAATLKNNLNEQRTNLVNSINEFNKSEVNSFANKINKPSLNILQAIKLGPFERNEVIENLELSTNKFYNIEEEDEKVKPGKKLVKSLRLNTGVFLTDRLQENKASDGLVLNNIRNDHEKSFETSQVELLLDLKLATNLSFSSGLSFTQTVEQLIFTKGEVASAAINGTKYLVPDLVGGFVSVDGLIEQTSTTNTDYEIYNRYRYIDIPLILNYKLGIKKWHLNVGLGTYVNLSTSATGSILNADFDFIDLTEGSVVKDRIRLSYGLSTSLGRSVGKRFKISAGPSIRTIPSITQDAYLLEQKYLLLGGKLGLRWAF